MRAYGMRVVGYLSPEPLLQSPTWVASELQSGRQVPSYSYAMNNPVRYVDPDGKWPLLLRAMYPSSGLGDLLEVGGVLRGAVGVAAGGTPSVQVNWYWYGPSLSLVVNNDPTVLGNDDGLTRGSTICMQGSDRETLAP